MKKVLLISLAMGMTYYIVGDRDVVKVVNNDLEGSGPRIIDCQKNNNQDPIGCIIAAEKIKEERAVLKKRLAPEKQNKLK